MKIFRYDKAIISKNSLTTTDEGYLTGHAVVTRIGPFKYLNDDGTQRIEYRDRKEVMKPESLETMKGIPVTLEHPTTFVNSANAKKLSVGFTGEQIETSDNEVMINFTITDQDAINSVKMGKRELSLGYYQDLHLTPGISEDGEKYDAFQTNIEYNHLAIVDRARAGRRARINLDSNYGEFHPKQEKKTMLVKINGVDHEVDEATGKAIIEQQKANDAAIADSKKDAATQRARADSAQATLHQKEVAEKERIDKENKKILVDSVKPILGDSYNYDSESQQIQKDVVLKFFPETNFDNENAEPVYIKARFDTCIELYQKNLKNTGGQMISMQPKENNDGNGHNRGNKEIPVNDKVEAARIKMDSVYRNAWISPSKVLNARSMDAAYNNLQNV